jgi:hypothetical protein
MPDGDEVRLWYQRWPLDIGESLHDEARNHYKIGGDSSRPDLVIERQRDGATIDAVLLELKASRNAGTLSGGLLQLLGYLKDRPVRFTRRPSGWLVPLPSDAARDFRISVEATKTTYHCPEFPPLGNQLEARAKRARARKLGLWRACPHSPTTLTRRSQCGDRSTGAEASPEAGGEPSLRRVWP